MDHTDRKTEPAPVERAALWIVEKGLAMPAVFLLEMHKPVAPVGSMMLLGAMPFLGPFVGFGAIERAALFAEDRGNIERLIRRIEELDGERTARAAELKDVQMLPDNVTAQRQDVQMLPDNVASEADGANRKEA